MDAMMIAINALLILNALVLVVSVLMQDGAKTGLGAITGGAETFFGKNKAKGYEAKLKIITKVSVTAFILLAILMTAYNAKMIVTSPGVDLTQAPKVQDLLKAKWMRTLDTTLPQTPGSGEDADEDAEPEGGEGALVITPDDPLSAEIAPSEPETQIEAETPAEEEPGLPAETEAPAE